MKQSIQLRLGQSLTMTPQLQQAIRLLQLSTLELKMEVQQALESNMMLELDDEPENDNQDNDSQNSDGKKAEETRPEQDSSSEAERSNGAGESEAVDANSQEIPEELPVDSNWDDIYDSVPAAAPAGEFSGMEFENQRGPTETLAQQLLWRVNISTMSETDKVIAMAIVDSLNEDGYLGCSLEDIQDALGSEDELEVDLAEIEAVLRYVQTLDIPGLAARDLGECMLLQLAHCVPDTAWLKEAKILVTEHLDLLAARDYNQLMRRMKLDKDDLHQVISLIQAQNPRPGSQSATNNVEYVVPDVFVRKHKSQWQVELNPDAVPALRVNPFYLSLIRRADSSPDNVSLKTHLQEARWFIKSLQSRSDTLLRVATAIVARQQGFLEQGEEAMKPLVLHDIATTLEMHESTVSRVTTQKYLHTPRGIFELKYFFSSHVNTTMGGVASSTAIRAVIKKMIASEDAVKPLSDSMIAKLLSERGIKVARRTVAKYREAMTIPPSNERKRLV